MILTSTMVLYIALLMTFSLLGQYIKFCGNIYHKVDAKIEGWPITTTCGLWALFYLLNQYIGQ